MDIFKVIGVGLVGLCAPALPGDWAAYMGIEAVFIDRDTTIRRFRNELKWNALVYRK